MNQKLQNTIRKDMEVKENSELTGRLIDAVVRATKDTFSDMLSIKVRSGEPLERRINTDSGILCEICAIISFVGDVSGVLMLKCSKRVAAELASRMLGTAVESDSDDLRDAIGELLNIIIGSAKSYYSHENAFKLSIPTTVIGRDFSLYIKANAGDSVFYVPLISGNARMGIELYVK